MNTCKFTVGKHNHFSVERQVCTAKEAEEWLSDTPHVRPIAKRRIERYAHDMRKHGWLFTGETIRICAHCGRLLNGHHRLKALSASGTSAELLFVYGIEPSTLSFQDSGLATRTSDWSERPNATAGYAVASALVRFLSPKNPGWLDSRNIKDLAWDHIGDENIQWAISATSRVKQLRTAPGHLMLALIRRIDQSRAQEMVDAVAGLSMKDGSPEQAYIRQRLNGGPVSVEVAGTLAMRVAVAAVRGESLKIIRPCDVNLAIRELRLGALCDELPPIRAHETESRP